MTLRRRVSTEKFYYEAIELFGYLIAPPIPVSDVASFSNAHLVSDAIIPKKSSGIVTDIIPGPEVPANVIAGGIGVRPLCDPLAGGELNRCLARLASDPSVYVGKPQVVELSKWTAHREKINLLISRQRHWR